MSLPFYYNVTRLSRPLCLWIEWRLHVIIQASNKVFIKHYNLSTLFPEHKPHENPNLFGHCLKKKPDLWTEPG